MWATHIRAGDLSIERTCEDASLEYLITVTLYRDTRGVEPFDGRINTGDGSNYDVGYISRRLIGNETEVIIYQLFHTYRAPGNYRISFFQQNRNAGILNVAAPSDSYPFYIEGEFVINPILGCNRSPRMLLPPIDLACVGQKFLHNSGAYDDDGDSLSYRLINSRISSDRPVPGFEYPQAGRREDGGLPGRFFIDAKTGDLTWDAPIKPGQYNVAFMVDEWRNGIKISSINRDMQIIVLDCNNIRPRIFPPRDTCVVAGDIVTGVARAIDPDIQAGLSLSASGGPFVLTPPSQRATFSTRSPGSANLQIGDFRWQTSCNDVRDEPYQVIFRAVDFPFSPERPLVDIRSWFIKVIGPRPENLTATQDNVNVSVRLDWDRYTCSNALKMTIWRRVGSYNFSPVCEPGLPQAAGYQKVGEVPIGTTTFTDRTVRRGTNYCYRIYAEFPQPGGGKSLASQEVCAFFPAVAPYMTNVDITQTDSVNGKIFVRWTQAPNLDSTKYPRPITYRLARAEGASGTQNYKVIGQIFNELDTFFNDQNLNTASKIYNYRVILLSRGNVIDSSIEASSVRLSAQGERSLAIRLRWFANTPWSIISASFPKHYIYRSDLNTQTNFKLIDSVNVLTDGLNYLDSGQYQGQRPKEEDRYCYFVSTYGTYGPLSDVFEPLINRSQIICGIVPDTTLPCPPILSLTKTDCEALGLLGKGRCGQPADCNNIKFENLPNWRQQQLPGCSNDDIVAYRLYTAKNNGKFSLLRELADTAFLHESLATLSYCYYVTAVDNFGNESRPSNTECNHDCEAYPLPNIFSPNADGINDVFRPCQCTNFVKSVDIKILGRWGNLVYEYSGDPEIRWDGGNLPAGTYYYQVKVLYLSGRSETQKGWVTIATP